MQILSGIIPSNLIKNEIKQKLNNTDKLQLITLAIILVGDDYASQLYVSHKITACQEVGIATKLFHYNNDVDETVLIKQIELLNNDDNITGILVQLPLPPILNSFKILNTINQDKDVDGLTAINAGKLLQGDSSAIISCTVKGIIKLLDYYQIPIKKQNITIINNSNIIGKPLSMILNNNGASISMVHKNTTNMGFYLKQANIIITATGVHNLFSTNDVNPKAIIIDVGINKQKKEDKVVGDVNYQEMKNFVKAITPVPGGVGPMTIAMLLENLFNLWEKKNKK